jgi:glycosyltransferase involved in cell wall biosynthesis
MSDTFIEAAERQLVFVGHTAELGGAELCLLDIAEHCRGARVCLFAHGPLVDSLQARGVPVDIVAGMHGALRVRRDGGPASMARALPATLALVRRLHRTVPRSALLYAYTQKGWIVTALTACWSRRTAVWHLHDMLSPEHFSRVLARTAVVLANRVASAVIVNSRATGDSFAALGGRRELVRVVHNGIDPAPFATAAACHRTALRAELAPGPGPLIGVFGRISPWKGQHVLLEALRDLPGARVVIVGAPLFGERAYLHRLEQLVAEPSLAGRVKFLGFRADIADLLHAVDIVAHTSIAAEPFGRVVVEAMLAGRATVATAAGGVPEIIEHGKTGLLVAPNDAVALRNALAALLEAPDRAAALGAAGRVAALAQFTRTHMLANLAAVLAEVAPLSNTSRVCHEKTIQSET